ncbi:sensor histidine kinase [Erythrobacter sp. GH1-10]|uniref:sensor histidine kinase n=1 Tax=Erythrobacter sp. GH1-10 TaxID=3349334 RepID=UPI003877A5B7
MGFRQSFPLAGILLAIVAFVAMLLLDVEPILSLAVLVVWVGSLVLVSGQPPEAPQTVVKESVSLDSMRDLIENSATPVLVTDKNTIAIANAAARRVMGRHMLGQDARVTFRQPEAIALLNSNRNGRAIVRGLVRRQDIWEINRQAVDEQMAVIELINQTAEADISRAHTDFVANASHELRTPLAAILGYVETLSESVDSLDSPTSKRFLNTIESEGKRLQSLISDLMSLSRVEAEKHDLPRELIALGPLVERAASDAAGPDRSQRLDLDLDRDLNVRGDRQQLEQLVRNLVDNALKYGNPDSPVKVALAVSRDKQARLSVVDEGEGISAEHVPHLTRRFYRTDPGRSRASGGTGLGLAIVKHIVERHRGRLDIESDLGKGTRVTVRLPLAESEGNDALPPGKGDKAPATPELS